VGFLLALFGATSLPWRRRGLKAAWAVVWLHGLMLLCVAIDVFHAFSTYGGEARVGSGRDQRPARLRHGLAGGGFSRASAALGGALLAGVVPAVSEVGSVLLGLLLAAAGGAGVLQRSRRQRESV